METILHRIQKIATNERLSIGAFERKIGASKGVLSRAIAKGTDIQAKWVQVLVENYPQYNANWLLTGTGTMLRNSEISHPSPPSAISAATPMAAPPKEPTMQPPTPPDAVTTQLLALITDKDLIIRQLSEEIGRLKQQIVHLMAQKKATPSRST